MKNDNVLNGEVNEALKAVHDGHYCEAIQRFDILISRQQRMIYFGGRGKAYFLSGNAEAALSDFLAIRNFSPQNHSVETVGVALWAMGEFEKACQDWAEEIERIRSGKIIYTDAAGGVECSALLWWGSAHPDLRHWREIAEQSLKRLIRTKKCRSNWPGPIAQFLLENITASQLIESTSSSYSRVEANREALSQFYIGAKYLAANDIAQYKLQLAKQSTLQTSMVTAERLLAYYELSIEGSGDRNA